jgi:hypothetical protein
MALFTFYRLAEAGQVVRDRHTLSPGSSGDELRGVLTSDTPAMLRAPSPRVVETLAHSHKESRRAYRCAGFETQAEPVAIKGCGLRSLPWLKFRSCARHALACTLARPARPSLRRSTSGRYAVGAGTASPKKTSTNSLILGQ